MAGPTGGRVVGAAGGVDGMAFGAPVGTPVTLTRPQQLFWVSQRLEPESPLLNMAFRLRISAPLEAQRLVRAFDDVVRASESLRLVVDAAGGVPQGRVLTHPPRRTEVLALPAEAFDEWAGARIASPIDLREAAYDSVLLEHAPDDWSWLLLAHHVALDATGFTNVFAAVARRYEGHDVDLPTLAEVEADIATFAGGPRGEAARRFWASPRDEVVETVLYRSAAVRSTRARRVVVPDAAALARRLRERLGAPDLRSISADVSMLAALCASVAVYVARVTGRDRVVVGVPTHGRPTPAAKRHIGHSVELFPLVVAVADGDSLRAVYERVKADVISLLRHAVPGTSPRQAFDIVVNFATNELADFAGMPVTLHWVPCGHIDPHHALQVQVNGFGARGELTIELDVNEAVADADQQRRAPRHLAAVLNAFVDDPDVGVLGFPLLDDEERVLTVEVYNDTGPGAEPATTVVDDVRAALAAAGDRVVLVDGALRLSGSQLDAAIDAVASAVRPHLRAAGDRIAVRIPRSAEAFVAIHGVLRAGGAFVPVDPSYPEARQRHIIENSGARMVLEHLEGIVSLERIDDADATVPTESSATDRAPSLDDLAYVIYTSGSTGLPKGVPITHRGLAEYVDFARRAYVEPGHSPTMALISSLSFDLTITSLFVPVVAGGRVVVYREDGIAGLRALVDDRQVDLLKLTPSHLELLTRLVEPDTPLRTLVVGGEALHVRTVRDLAAAVGRELRVFNEYGPTEAVVGCMIHRYDPVRDADGDVPIGVPAPGVRLHVLDRGGHPVPIGVTGELHIVRPGMTAGYLDAPHLDVGRFVRVPGVADDVLYRTGDLVRMIDPSTMLYLGRADEQLKVQGVRLEAGEIEAAIGEVPGVEQAVVRVWEPSSLERRLRHCSSCGLPSNVPGVAFDAKGRCSVCHAHDAVRDRAATYFGTEDDLRTRLLAATARKRGRHDVLHLLSPGPNSTYALHRLASMGFQVRALTLDHGYLSQQAKADVCRLAADLGIEHELVTVEGMDEIIRDSLQRHADVATGWSEAVLAAGLARADDLGIPVVTTGLSRAAMFESRLMPALVEGRGLDVDATDDIVDRVDVVDFFRYDDAEHDEIVAVIAAGASPIASSDRASLLDQVGSWVHRRERGFRDDALRRSWDVRLGRTTRDEAMDELDRPVDEREVTRLLAAVGYHVRPTAVLTAWYRASRPIEPDELRSALLPVLPAFAVPRAFVAVDEIPLTPNGKVDVEALPPPARRARSDDDSYVAPDGPVEEHIAEIWADVLGLERVGATDDFFALGGVSLSALEMVIRIGDGFGVELPEATPFRLRTVAALAAEVDRLLLAEVAGLSDEEIERRMGAR